ncbi:MAG: adenosylmethionine--8-amino-7-oxononanoate transaminase [Kiritimatiellae bacterium]|nr:adenosylmethionine--8-amino-7-oxononanoate transaminase [Kiritimatiellia bacterium]MDW8459073.1 adenosylmethionine--8-amino-7-oxononanoate transaminase [Verrucomicrobiota bacterium]
MEKFAQAGVSLGERAEALEAVRAWDRAHVWHPYTRASTLEESPPPCIVRGEGIYLVDDTGRLYIDAISSWWCAALGHGHPRIVEAIRRQAPVLQHSILANLTHPQAAELAWRLARMMPTDDRRVLFASDGASAVEQALKIAVQYWHNIGRPERKTFACIHGAYHGDTLGAMAVGYLEAWHKPFCSLLAETICLPFPPDPNAENWIAVLEPRRHDLAAVIVEPLCLGAAGMKMYPASALRALAEWCRNSETLLIVDEIATGFGRTGRWFAFEHAGIDPDLVCVGKALTAGSLPMSATIARESLYRTFADRPVDRTLQHGHTFCGNPIAAAAANEALRIYEEIDAPARAARLGRLLADSLGRLRGANGVREVRCLGLIGAVELEPEPTVPGRPPLIPRPHRIRLNLMRQGILLRPLGPVLYLMPPLIITEGELCDLADRFVDAILAGTSA